MEPLRDAILTALEGVIDPELRRPVTELDMVRDITVDDGRFDVMSPDERAALTAKLRGARNERSRGISVDAATRVIAVASGKGGVGKSSLTANLAAAFAQRGERTWILDADVYGHSIPHLLGIRQRPVLVVRIIVTT